jgi:AbrB family looped-hinge helix DNA binding protein
MDQTEMECYPTVRDRGQVTIPEEVRETLGIEPGDRVKLTVERLE